MCFCRQRRFLHATLLSAALLQPILIRCGTQIPQLQSSGPCAAPRRGESLFPSFMSFLQAQGGEQGEKEQELVGQLREVNDALSKSDGPFLVRAAPLQAQAHLSAAHAPSVPSACLVQGVI